MTGVFEILSSRVFSFLLNCMSLRLSFMSASAHVSLSELYFYYHHKYLHPSRTPFRSPILMTCFFINAISISWPLMQLVLLTLSFYFQQIFYYGRLVCCLPGCIQRSHPTFPHSLLIYIYLGHGLCLLMAAKCNVFVLDFFLFVACFPTR